MNLMYNEVYLNILPDYVPKPGSKDWNHLQNWGYRLVTTFDPKNKTYIHWQKNVRSELYSYLEDRDITIGYNWTDFDSQILANLKNVIGFSVMHEVQNLIGVRLKLENLARANGLKGYHRDLAVFLNKNPNLQECKIFNIDKIRFLKRIMNQAINNNFLYYLTLNGKKKRMETKHWKDTLNKRRISS